MQDTHKVAAPDPARSTASSARQAGRTNAMRPTLTRAAEKADPRRFTGESITGFGALASAPRAYPLMLPTPTGHWTNVGDAQLRPEFKESIDRGGLDAPDWYPTGGCFAWGSSIDPDTVYTQPHGFNRECGWEVA